MSERYRVRISKDYLLFCSGHFITYEGHSCEGLHGHNYRAAVELEGTLNENCYLFDFVTLKKIMRRLTDELDHKMLLPANNPLIKLTQAGGEIEARYKAKRWLFPAEDCLVLPIENTTAELLARHVAGRLRQVLREEHQYTAKVIRLEVEETAGQAAIYEWTE